jgi:hypothetical protein
MGDCLLPITHCRLVIADWRLPIADSALQTLLRDMPINETPGR